MLTKSLLKEQKPNLMLISGKNDDKFQNIYTGTALSPAGNCFIAWAIDGDNDSLICFLAFVENTEESIAKHDLKKLLPGSLFKKNNVEAKNLIAKIFDTQNTTQIKLLIKGTPFQEKIWRTLTEVNFGTIISYQELARRIGSINSTRAVASAVAKNNISYLIPCHRVIRKSGNINKYRWGVLAKQKLIDWESGLYSKSH